MAIRRSDLCFTFLLPVVFFILGYAEYLNSERNTQLLEYLVVPISLIAIVYYYYKYYPAFLFTSAMPFYYYIGMCISLLLVNNGVHMIEVDQYGSPNGSVLIMLAYFFYSIGISNTVFSTVIKKGSRTTLPKISIKLAENFIVLIISSIIMLGFAIMLFYSGPVLKGMNRVLFWQNMEPSGLSFYPTLLLQSFYFAGYLYLSRCYDRNRSILANLMLLSYIFLAIFVLGEKFSAFIIYFTIFCFLLPSFTKNLRIKKKTFFLLFLCFLSLMLIIVLSYLAQGYDSEFIFARVALQGQVLWSVINFDFPLLVTDNSCLFNCAGYNGISDYISFKYLPINTYLHYSATSTKLSGFAPAAQFLTMGLLPTLILQTLVFALLGYLQAKTVIYNRERNFFVGFLFFKISFSLFLIWHAVMFTAIKGMLFTAGILLIYALVAKANKSYKERNCEPK